MPDETGIPFNIFGGDAPVSEEEKPKLIGDKIREEQKAAKAKRGKPSLQSWYKEALSKREYTDRASLASAYNATQAKLENTKDKYPYGGFDRHFVERQITGGTIDAGVSEGSGKAVINNSRSYADKISDAAVDELKTNVIADWTSETKDVDGDLINWKGEKLPPRASGWQLDGETPYYGTGNDGVLRKALDAAEQSRLIFQTQVGAEPLSDIEIARTALGVGVDVFTSDAEFSVVNNLVWDWVTRNITKPAEQWVGTQLISMQLMAEAGDPILWQKTEGDTLVAEAEFEAKYGYEPPTKALREARLNNWAGDFFDRISPVKYAGNAIIMLARLAKGDIKLSEINDYRNRATELGKFAWSLAYQDTADIKEFEHRVNVLGENPDLVALDMEQPWSEALGRTIVNPVHLISPIMRTFKTNAQMSAAWKFANSPVDEVSAVYMQWGDELAGVKTASGATVFKNVEGKAVPIFQKIFGGEAAVGAGEAVEGAFSVAQGVLPAGQFTDDVLAAYNTASSRVMAGVNNNAINFGLVYNNGASKQHLALQSAKLVLLNIVENVKNADSIADVIANLAKLQSSSPEEQKAAWLMLNEQLTAPHLAMTEPTIEFSILLKEVMQDADGTINPSALIKNIETAIESGIEPTEVVISIAEKAVKNIYPTTRDIIDAENALAKNPDASISPSAQRFFDNGGKLSWIDRTIALTSAEGKNIAGVYGAIHRLQKRVSSTVFVGMNFPVAMRGALHDNVMMSVIQGPGVQLHSAEAAAERTVKWLDAAHPGFMQTFSTDIESGLNSWAKKVSGQKYDNMGSLMDAILNKGNPDRFSEDLVETVTNFGGRSLAYTEQKSGQKIISYAVEQAMRDLIEKCLPDLSGLIIAGLPRNVANKMAQLFINDFGNVSKVEDKIMKYLSGEEPIREKDLMGWMDDKSKSEYERLGLLKEVERIVVESKTLDEALETLDIMRDGQLALEKQIYTHYPVPQTDPINKETDIGFIQDAAFEAAADDLDGSINLDIASLNEVNSKIQATTNVTDSIGRAIDFIKEEVSSLLRNSALTKQEINYIIDKVLGPKYEAFGDPRQRFREVTGLNRTDMVLSRDFGRDLIASKGKVELAKIWGEIQKDLNIPGDVPENKWLAKDKMWTTVFARNTRLFQEARIEAVAKFTQFLTDITSNGLGGDTAIAKSILESPMVEAVRLNEIIAIQMDNSVIVDGVMKPIGPIISGHVGMGDTANAVRAIASYLNPHIGVFRADNVIFDNEIIRIVSKMSGELYTTIDDIPPNVAFNAYNKFRVSSLELAPTNYTYDDVVNYKPEVRVPIAIEPQNIINKYDLVGQLDDVDLRKLYDFAKEYDALEAHAIVSKEDTPETTAELVEYVRNVIKEMKDTPPAGSKMYTAEGWVKAGEKVPTPELSIATKEFPVTKSNMVDGNLVEETRMLSSEVKEYVSPAADTPLNYEQIESLANQMKISGWDERQWPPIEVTINADGSKIVTDGQHRAIAAATARLEDVPVRVTTLPSTIVEPSNLIDDIEPIVPPHDGSADIAAGRDIHEQRNILEAAIRRTKEQLKRVWDKKEYANVTQEAKKEAKNFFDEMRKRMVEIKNAAAQYAQATRDRILHDYSNRFGIDGLLSMFRNFHFWPTRTMYQWAKRAPYYLDYIQAYLNYQEAMDKYHADRPAWLRQSWSTNEIFGLDAKNPVYLSLAGILDIYQNVVGGFEDEDRRATWFTTIVDQLSNKFPGSMGMVMQWAIAAGLKAIGEDEAAAKWAGRSIPLTQTVKGLTSIVGINEGRGIDLDPSVWAFSSNNQWDDMVEGRTLGAYDEQRVAVAMGHLISKYPNIPEELLDQAKAHEGPLWDEATSIVAKQGAWGNVISFFTGINARARSEDDLVVSQFWQEYIFLMTQYETTDAKSWRTNRDALMKKYPFAETMLLGRKNTEEREIAYGYAVLSRIPPGQTDDVSKAAGFKYDIISYFYDNKGDITGLPPEDQQKLMIFFAEAGASIAIPDKATKGEFAEASFRYAKMLEEGQKVFGTSIWDKVDAGFNLKGESLNSQDTWYDYLEEHPEVNDAMRWQSEYILQDPVLSAYYGSIDRLRNFWKGDMYQKLEEEFGKDIWDIQTQYWIYSDTEQKEQAKAWLKKYPQLEKYWEKKNKYYTPIITQSMADYGEKLPEGQDLRLRQDFDREAASSGAQDIATYIESPKIKSYTKDEWLTILGQTNMSMAMLAWEMGKKFPSDLKERLESVASGMGMSYDEFILSIGQAP